MQYLDALEGLRTQGVTDETIPTRCYENLKRFIDGVRDLKLRQELAVLYEVYLTEPPTVESFRFTTRQLQRHRPTVTKQPYDPLYAIRSRPHPFLSFKLVHPAPRLPQGVLPPAQPVQNAKPT